MDPLSHFIAEQEKTYRAFSALAETARQKGIMPDPNLDKRFGGFFVVLIHPMEIARRAEEMSRATACTIPALLYRARDVHTTVGSFLYGKGFSPDAVENPEKILRDLADAAETTVKEAKHGAEKCTVDYGEYLYTQAVLIAAGIPNLGFVHVVDTLEREAKKRGITLKRPWGSHMTLNRFSAPVQRKNLDGFLALVSDAKPIGRSAPIALSVGYALQNPTKHKLFAPKPHGHFTPYRTFPLNP